MVPPRSNRVSRAPPYSRTKKLPYPYRAVTVCGAPFQALPVRALWPLAWSAFARRYLRSRACCPFLRLLRCFSSPGSPHAAMDSPHDPARVRWVAPFGDPRINGRSPLPSAFRSVPRPSSPLGAKASTRCPSCAAPAPSPKHAALPRAEIRCQMTDVRWLRTRPRGRRFAFSDLRSLSSDLGSRCASTAPPMLAHRLRIPMPRPDLIPRGFPLRTMAGPASRSRLASRCQQNRGQRTDDRPDGPSRAPPSQLAVQTSEDAPRELF